GRQNHHTLSLVEQFLGQRVRNIQDFFQHLSTIREPLPLGFGDQHDRPNHYQSQKPSNQAHQSHLLPRPLFPRVISFSTSERRNSTGEVSLAALRRKKMVLDGSEDPESLSSEIRDGAGHSNGGVHRFGYYVSRSQWRSGVQAQRGLFLPDRDEQSGRDRSLLERDRRLWRQGKPVW